VAQRIGHVIIREAPQLQRVDRIEHDVRVLLDLEGLAQARADPRDHDGLQL
jgi:hypothetical protein